MCAVYSHGPLCLCRRPKRVLDLLPMHAGPDLLLHGSRRRQPHDGPRLVLWPGVPRGVAAQCGAQREHAKRMRGAAKRTGCADLHLRTPVRMAVERGTATRLRAVPLARRPGSCATPRWTRATTAPTAATAPSATSCAWRRSGLALAARRRRAQTTTRATATSTFARRTLPLDRCTPAGTCTVRARPSCLARAGCGCSFI